MYEEVTFIQQWKDRMRELIKVRHPNVKFNKKKLEAYLDNVIQKRINNRKVTVINNYTNQVGRSDILSLINLIEKNHLIMSGGGCLFVQHGTKENLLVDFILGKMDQRKLQKKERKNYEKGTLEYATADRAQDATKLIINSLYGCLGYPGFLLYNIFLAEAITNQGRHIITTAINAFEGFLGDARNFDNENELFTFIYNVHTEAKRYREVDPSSVMLPDMPNRVHHRLLEKCKFEYSRELSEAVRAIVYDKSDIELCLLYYKNNLMEFNRNPCIKTRFKDVLTEVGKLLLPDISLLPADELKEKTEELWTLYEIYVLYDYQTFDKVRKAMYKDKARSLYTDTDSVFISLYHLIDYVIRECFHKELPMDIDTMSLTVANYIMIFLNRVIDRAMKTLCYSSNITPEWAKLLMMKNEFVLKRILFVEVKKRYLSLALLQEGALLKGGDGLPEIKGFDFTKGTTKEFLHQYYEQMSINDILKPAVIHPNEIFDKMVALKNSIEVGVRSGDNKYFKQSNVKLAELYKNPYSTQGITAIMAWNALVPESVLELPNDVNIIPIKELTFKKPSKKEMEDRTSDGGIRAITRTPLDNPNVAELAQKYPDVYQHFYEEIYCNPNLEIRHMTIKNVATPKNENIPIPPWIYELIDYEKITQDALSLFLPIMQSISLKSLPITTNDVQMTNIVSL